MRKSDKIRPFSNNEMATVISICLYLMAIVLANALVTHYGQAALPWVAFSLIPFDLIARDFLQDRWQYSKWMGLRIGTLIFIGGCLSVATGTGSFRVSVASFAAFTVAGMIDALTYQTMIKYGRVFRINAATLTAAITDSIIFVYLAFDKTNWYLVGLQIGMKVAGGFVWSLLLYRMFQKRNSSQRENCWLCTDDQAARVVCDCHFSLPNGSPTPCNVTCNKGGEIHEL